MPASYGSIAPSTPADESPRDGALARRDLLALASLSLLTVGPHYAKHSLSGLGPALMSTLNVERLSFGLLFALPQAPGVLLPVIGGLLLSGLPLAPAALALTLVLLVSTALCAAAVDVGRYRVLLAGRVLFGLADGLLTTVQGALIARRFQSSGRVSLAFGGMLFASRTSSFAGFALPPAILEHAGLSAAMWASTVAMLIPVSAAFAYIVLCARFPSATVASPAAASDLAALHPRALIAVCRRLSPPFWAVAYTFTTVACSTFAFLHFAPDAFRESVGMSPGLSALLSGLLFLAAGLASPFIGGLADRFGHRSQILLVSAASATAGIVVCAAAVRFPLILGQGAALLGLLFLAFSLAVAPVVLLSCVAMLVQPVALPLALGAYKSVENAGVAIAHVVIGGLRDATGSYFWSLVFVAFIAVSCVPALVWLGGAAPGLELSAREIREGEGDRDKV